MKIKGTPSLLRGAVIAVAGLALLLPTTAFAGGATPPPPPKPKPSPPAMARDVLAGYRVEAAQTAALGRLQDALGQNATTYAGMTTRGPASAVIHLAGSASAVDPAVAGLKAAAEAQNIKVTIDHRAHSLAELQKVQDAIPSSAPFAALGGALVKWGIEPESNSVQVGVTSVTPDLVAQARAAFGDAVTVVQTDPVTSDLNRFNDIAPYYGGDRIDGPSFFCSSAFTVTDFNDNDLMLTAGHCFSQGDNVYVGTQKIGYVETRSYGDRQLDVEFLWNGSSTSNMAGAIYLGGVSASGNNPVLGVHGAANSCSGCRVYFDGSVTGQSLGYLTDGPRCIRFDGVVSCGLQEVVPLNGPLSTGGDSGGPVFAYDGNGGVTAVGIIKGHNSSGHAFYTRVPDILDHFGVSIKRG
jgi:hypothetical protein